MKIYTLKWLSTYNYNLYDGETLVSDTDLDTLFGSAGSAYFVFDFNNGTPTQTDRVYVRNAANTANKIYKTGLSTGTVKQDYHFQGTWDSNASQFKTFTRLPGRTLDEIMLSDLMHEIKNAGGGATLDNATFNEIFGTDLEES